ncbi:MAG: hypothetical protein KGK16_10440, partial [Bradyrhizobium sp.]|nr:hypothetical protein [Bradyrhizobium sp.]
KHCIIGHACNSRDRLACQQPVPRPFLLGQSIMPVSAHMRLMDTYLIVLERVRDHRAALADYQGDVAS